MTEDKLKRIDDALDTILETLADLQNTMRSGFDDMRSEFKALNTRLDGMLDKEE